MKSLKVITILLLFLINTTTTSLVGASDKKQDRNSFSYKSEFIEKDIDKFSEIINTVYKKHIDFKKSYLLNFKTNSNELEIISKNYINLINLQNYIRSTAGDFLKKISNLLNERPNNKNIQDQYKRFNELIGKFKLDVIEFKEELKLSSDKVHLKKKETSLEH